MSRQQIISRLGRASEYRDDETGNHVLRVAHYSRLIAEAYGLGQKAASIIFSTAPMHDVGKIGIRDSILLKPGKLDSQEWEIMRLHPVMGAEIIGKHENEMLETARIIALTHHERWDGAGYPSQLKGEDIPLEGRVVAIADVFDALLSARPYKEAFSIDKSIRIMDAEDGTHFDPQLMEAFRKALPEILKVKEAYADEKGPMTDHGMADDFLPDDE